MARYLGPRFKVLRRLGKLPGLGELPELNNQGTRPQRPKKISQFGKQLQEKQKLRYNYGLGERQLMNAVRKARKGDGSAGENLLQTLEMRLDCILFRCGAAKTIPAARQLVTHGHILVNEKRVNIPSYICQIGDSIGLQSSAHNSSSFSSQITTTLPNHLRFQKDSKNQVRAIVKAPVNRNQVSVAVQELLVIEYYSRRI